jgi:SdrD B-like domain
MRTAAVALAGLLSLAAQYPAQAGQCLTSDSPGKICTANDFELVSEELISDPTSCSEGETIPGDIVVRIGIEGNRKETYDVGFFIGDGASSPINGESCTFDSLTPIENVGNPFDGNSGAGPYRDLDSNQCGDADKDDGVIFKDFTLSNVLCQDENNDGALDVKYAITWKQNDEVCDDPTDPANFDLATTSKCINAIGDVAEIPVLPPDPTVPSIRVQKIATPVVINPGGDVDYTVNVANEGPIDVTLDTLMDDRFGDITVVQGNITSTSCTLPQVISPGQVYTCSFNAFPTGAAPSTHTNIVTGSGTGGGDPVSDSGQAFVAIVDIPSGGIGYLVWNDLDADGAKDENEQGIPGVTVNLLNGNGAFLQSRVTDADGYYAFQDLTAGFYQVQVVEDNDIGNPIADLVRTTANNPFEVSLLPTQVVSTANFGYVGAQISLQKDANPQVVNAPGEPVDFTIVITNTGAIPVMVTDLADSQFGNLFDSGSCAPPAVDLAPLETYSCTFTEQVSGSAGDTHTNTAQTVAEDADGNQVFAADDALVGIEDPMDGAIGNLVWLDTNGNGALDEGEQGLNNVTLRLSYDSDDNGSYETVVGDTVTLNSGEYGFIGLNAGNYRLEVTDDNQILNDRYLTNPPEPLDIALTPGQIFADADFGYNDIPKPRIVVFKTPTQYVHQAPSAAVTYRVSVLNIGDTPVRITELVDSRFGALDALDDSTCALNETITTRNTYKCRFTETINGDPLDVHRNRVTAIGTDPNGNVAFDSDPAFIIFVDPSEGAIGDLVWDDLNADGVFDEGEPGIANVTVELFRAGVEVGSTVTDASGNYRFIGLAAGQYEVVVTDTAGVLTGRVLTGGTEPMGITLGIGEIFMDADFGYATAAIELVKEGDRKVLIQPGGDITYTITTRNVGYLDVTLTSLIDDKFGDLNGQGDCRAPLLVPARSSVACSFTAALTGDNGDIHTNTVTANAIDAGNNALMADAYFDVYFVGVDFGAAGYLVWDDENGNGIRETSEPGIASVTLALEVDEDNNGTFERQASTAVTRANGFYAFFPVPTGNWRIRVTDDYGILRGRVLTGGANPNEFDLGGGELYTDANFGYYDIDNPGGVIPPRPEPPDEPEEITTVPLLGLGFLILAILSVGTLSARRRRPRAH